MSDSARAIDQAVGGMADGEGKFLTFALDREQYGIGILRVKEIIRMMPITRVPRAPAFIKGVINLRGRVIPVVDLRLKFGMEETPYTERTCIIVVDMKVQRGSALIGMVVDSVSEVLNIKAADIEESPAFGARLDTDYIFGLAKINGEVKILLDISRVLTGDEIIGFDRAG